jgi:hypothetical protein
LVKRSNVFTPVVPFYSSEQEATNDVQQPIEAEELVSQAHHQQPEMHHHQPDDHHHHHQQQIQEHHHHHHQQQELQHQGEMTGQQQPEQHHQAMIQHHETALESEPSQDAPQIALQPLLEHAQGEQQQQQGNIPQQIIIQPQTMIIPPAQGSPPRVSVHYLTSNTTSQPRAAYSPALQHRATPRYFMKY